MSPQVGPKVRTIATSWTPSGSRRTKTQVTTILLTLAKWSARDLAKLFGYSEWRKFTDSIRKAREQVGAHNIAGQPNSGDVAGNGGEHFVNTETVSRVGFGDRTVPDVHLTRFAAYFVALNADQSKPESTARDTPMRGCTQQPFDAVECYDLISCHPTISTQNANAQGKPDGAPY